MDKENKLSENLKKPIVKPKNPIVKPFYIDIYSQYYDGTKLKAGLLSFPFAK